MKSTDYGSRPPSNRYALPNGSYPTPNIDDLIITQDVNLPNGKLRPIPYGTPHPSDSTALLCGQEELESDVHQTRVRRTWVRDRAAQDAHNYQITYSGNGKDYPVFTRTYIERRDGYTPRSDLSALGVVYKLRLTAGGTGYTSTPTVTSSGGSGSGFAATAEIQSGVVVAIRITNCGTGYTSAPTIGFTGGGGSGAAATATVQPTACQLVEERAESALGVPGNFFLVVLRVYETLPGPVLVTYGYEPETMLATRRTTQRRATGSFVDLAPGDNLTISAVNWVILNVGRQPVSANVMEEVFDVIDPDIDGASRTEYVSKGFQFPAIFTFLLAWNIPAPSPFIKTGPFPGVNYDISPHITASKPAEVVYTYSNGPSGTVPNTWQVSSPGNASREFPIPANCIHNAFELFEDHGGGDIQTIEDIGASNPSSYSPGVTECIIQAGEERWKGPIYRKVVATVVE